MAIELTLDQAQAEDLLQVLEAYLGDLRYEIADTDSSTFKERLRTRQSNIQHVVIALKGAGISTEPTSP